MCWYEHTAVLEVDKKYHKEHTSKPEPSSNLLHKSFSKSNNFALQDKTSYLNNENKATYNTYIFLLENTSSQL